MRCARLAKTVRTASCLTSHARAFQIKESHKFAELFWQLLGSARCDAADKGRPSFQPPAYAVSGRIKFGRGTIAILGEPEPNGSSCRNVYFYNFLAKRTVCSLFCPAFILSYKHYHPTLTAHSHRCFFPRAYD